MKRKTTNRFIVLSLAAAFVFILFVNYVSASNEFWACIDRGETVNYCNNYKPSKTCTDTNGCTFCMSVYRANENCYIHGSWPRCLELDPASCSGLGGGNESVDGVPPILTLLSPLNNSIFTERNVPFHFTVSENADVYYLDLINGRGRWTRVCDSCSSYNDERRFNEGVNILSVRATDRGGNEDFEEVSFFVDSKDPRIKRTEPKKGFANGDFSAEIQEENPEELILHYGTPLNMKTKMLNINNDCEKIKTRTFCDTNVNLNEFNGMGIEYYFTLEDIAGNMAESKHTELLVDISPPVLTNPGNFWEQGTESENKFIFFDMKITEPNFDEVSYSYVDDRGKTREKRICSALKDGACVKKVSFRSGHYDLTVMVIDEAGNSVGFPVSFDVF